MSRRYLGKVTKKVPLFSLGLVSFLTMVLCQTHLQVIEDDSDIQSTENVFVWTYKNANIYGYDLKASVMVNSPILSATSTMLLLFGVAEMNPYFFLPWLILTFQGLAIVQVNNLIGLTRQFLDWSKQTQIFLTLDPWKSALFYALIIVFNISECYIFYEILVIFRLSWQYKLYYIIRTGKEKKLREKV